MITSSSNGQVKNVALLVKKSKERKAQGIFVVEGPKMCFEAPIDWVKAIYVSESYMQEEKNRQELKNYLDKAAGRISYEEVAESVFRQMSDTQTPQGILALVQMPHYELADLMQQENTLILCLESVQDPGNLGTMVRTGEGAGVTGVVMNSTTVDLFNPKTIRSTMGSIYRIPYVIVEDLPAAIVKLQENGVALYAAHLKGSASYEDKDYTGACGFLIGNEGNGLSDEVADLASDYIRIPMEGRVESLNAAMSAGILMYECNRQRRKGS